MTDLRLPEDGALRLGSVTLPAGQRRALTRPADPRIRVMDARPGDPVVWLTRKPVRKPGRVWWELSQACAGTGLVPFLADTMRGEPRRPWDAGLGDFCDPNDVTLIDDLDPAAILRQRWDWQLPVAEDHEREDWYQEDWQIFEEQAAPFSREFPGLAPEVSQVLEPALVQERLSMLRPRRIGLGVAHRPGDVLPAMGWAPANWVDGALPVAAVLRSWEERFGARLLEVEHGACTVLADRPPHTPETALRLAAEMFAFADEVHIGNRLALTEVSEIAPQLVDAPLWRFWWD